MRLMNPARTGAQKAQHLKYPEILSLLNTSNRSTADNALYPHATS